MGNSRKWPELWGNPFPTSIIMGERVLVFKPLLHHIHLGKKTNKLTETWNKTSKVKKKPRASSLPIGDLNRYSFGIFTLITVGIPSLLESFYGYCWWFRNPKQPPGMVLKPVVNHGIVTTNLNWWVYRISEPSTVDWTFSTEMTRHFSRDGPRSTSMPVEVEKSHRFCVAKFQPHRSWFGGCVPKPAQETTHRKHRYGFYCDWVEDLQLHPKNSSE